MGKLNFKSQKKMGVNVRGIVMELIGTFA